MSLRIRVFASWSIYRRKMDVGRLVGPPRHSSVRPHPRPRPPMAWAPGGSPPGPLGTPGSSRSFIYGRIDFFDSEDISFLRFLKLRTAENTELALWHLVNRLVLENA